MPELAATGWLIGVFEAPGTAVSLKDVAATECRGTEVVDTMVAVPP